MTKTEKTDDRSSTPITTANPNLGSTKKTSVPNYEDKPSNTKPNFGEQFKNAFKNTNPKNSANQKSEISKQIETKNNISQSLKKSLNINTDDKALESGTFPTVVYMVVLLSINIFVRTQKRKKSK